MLAVCASHFQYSRTELTLLCQVWRRVEPERHFRDNFRVTCQAGWPIESHWQAMMSIQANRTSKNGGLSLSCRQIINLMRLFQIIPVQVRCDRANETNFKHSQGFHYVSTTSSYLPSKRSNFKAKGGQRLRHINRQWNDWPDQLRDWRVRRCTAWLLSQSMWSTIPDLCPAFCRFHILQRLPVDNDYVQHCLFSHRSDDSKRSRHNRHDICGLNNW